MEQDLCVEAQLFPRDAQRGTAIALVDRRIHTPTTRCIIIETPNSMSSWDVFRDMVLGLINTGDPQEELTQALDYNIDS